jgi:uncharacterized Zn-binding protein involved in type VI secretion
MLGGVARLGDICFPECGDLPFAIISGSPSVVANGQPVATFGSVVFPHLGKVVKCKSMVPGTIISGSSSVVVDGQPAATFGSLQFSGSLPTPVISASPDVIVGP